MMNSPLNSRVYDIEFGDWTLHECMANMVSQNMYAQLDDAGIEHFLMSKIVGYQIDDYAFKKEDRFITRGPSEHR